MTVTVKTIKQGVAAHGGGAGEPSAGMQLIFLFHPNPHSVPRCGGQPLDRVELDPPPGAAGIQVVLGRPRQSDAAAEGQCYIELFSTDYEILGTPISDTHGQHAEIRCSNTSCHLISYGSLSFINGCRVVVHQRHRLQDGDLIRLGDFLFLFRNSHAFAATDQAAAAGAHHTLSYQELWVRILRHGTVLTKIAAPIVQGGKVHPRTIRQLLCSSLRYVPGDAPLEPPQKYTSRAMRGRFYSQAARQLVENLQEQVNALRREAGPDAAHDVAEQLAPGEIEARVSAAIQVAREAAEAYLSSLGTDDSD